MRQLLFSLFIISCLIFSFSCRTRSSEFVTVALSEKFSTLDTLTTTASDAAAERVRSLMFNSLVRKNEKFEYVGELAQEIKPSEDGKVITFILRDGVKFHNGKDFTSADVKYTFDELFRSSSYKAGAFYDTVDGQKTPHIVSLSTPDPKTVVVTLSRASLQNQLLSNFVAIPIIPEGTASQQAAQPIGSGPFKFVNFDQSQNIVELAAFPEYWEGAPKVGKLRVKTVTDANSLQAELQSGGVDIAPLPTNLSPDTLKTLGQNASLKVWQFKGSNIDYLGLNTTEPPLNNVKVRQAIAYGVNREKIINDLLFGQAVLAHSILPEESWAYNPNAAKYSYDPARAKHLLQEAGYKNEPIKFKYSAGMQAVNQYAQVIQSSLKEIGLNVEIETLDPNTLRSQLALGQFQMNTGRWIGGNQDPIFLKDLFSTGTIPGDKVKCCNRSRYSNPEFDKIIAAAIEAPDREKAKEFYFKAQEIVNIEVPLVPLWYPANVVVANKRIGGIQVGASGDWSFIRNVTVESK